MLEYLDNLSKFLDLLELNPHAACKNFTAQTISARSDVQALQVLALKLKSHPKLHAPDADICIWSPSDDYDIWHGSCGAELYFDESTPNENEFKFCPSCGRTLTQFVPEKTGQLDADADNA